MKKAQFRAENHILSARSSAMPGSARPCPGQRRPGAGIQGIPPHVPMSQSATRPLGRPLAYQIKSRTLAGSHNIACKLHAIPKYFQSSREAPTLHFPISTTLARENHIFHQTIYFHQQRKYASYKLHPLLVLSGASEKHGN